MASRIALRVDTAADWTAANHTLVKGEQGYESDTKRRKVGDGVTAWNSLPYDNGTAANLDTGSAAGELPTNGDLGTAAQEDTGTTTGTIPLNGGNASFADLTATGPTSLQAASATDITTDGLKRTPAVKTANYTMAITDSIIEVDSSAGPVTITLFDRSSALGRHYVVRKISSDANTVTINAAGIDTITRAGLSSVTHTSDGDFWVFFGGSTRWELVDGVESGTGFTRNSNGRQMVWGTIASSTSWTDSTGHRYTTGATSTFPKSFVQRDIDGIDIAPSDGAILSRGAWIIKAVSDNNGITDFRLGSVVESTTTISYDYSYRQTGRWYT